MVAASYHGRHASKNKGTLLPSKDLAKDKLLMCQYNCSYHPTGTDLHVATQCYQKIKIAYQEVIFSALRIDLEKKQSHEATLQEKHSDNGTDGDSVVLPKSKRPGVILPG